MCHLDLTGDGGKGKTRAETLSEIGSGRQAEAAGQPVQCRDFVFSCAEPINISHMGRSWALKPRGCLHKHAGAISASPSRRGVG